MPWQQISRKSLLVLKPYVLYPLSPLVRTGLGDCEKDDKGDWWLRDPVALSVGRAYVDANLASQFSERDGRGPWPSKGIIPLRAVGLLGHGVPVPHVSIPNGQATLKEE